MKRNVFAFVPGLSFIILFDLLSVLPGFSMQRVSNINLPDTLDKQVLYIGKLWWNRYALVKGDQFLFSREFQPGMLTINGHVYNDIPVNYDIYNDEVLIPKDRNSIIQLNKEMIDSFSINFGGKGYKFTNSQFDSLSGIKGFINQLYRGKTVLFVKYKKEIEELAVDDKYDLFYRTFKIFLLKDKHVFPISGKGDLLKVLGDQKSKLKAFMKKNKLKVTKKEPDSFVPLIKYYDSLSL